MAQSPYQQQPQQLRVPNQLFHHQQQLHVVPSTSAQLLSGIGNGYPPDSIESIVQNSNLLKRKRPKVYARDLTLVDFFRKFESKIFLGNTKTGFNGIA